MKRRTKELLASSLSGVAMGLGGMGGGFATAVSLGIGVFEWWEHRGEDGAVRGASLDAVTSFGGWALGRALGGPADDSDDD